MEYPCTACTADSVIMSSELATEATKKISCCCCCDLFDEPLYMCTKPDCTKVGEIFCLLCGQVSHRRRDHEFDHGLEHIVLVQLNDLKENIKVEQK